MCRLKVGKLKYADLETKKLIGLRNGRIVFNNLMSQDENALNISQLYSFQYSKDMTIAHKERIVEDVYKCIINSYGKREVIDIDFEIYDYADTYIRDIAFFSSYIIGVPFKVTIMRHCSDFDGMFKRDYFKLKDPLLLEKVIDTYRILYGEQIKFTKADINEYLTTGKAPGKYSEDLQL